MTGKTDWGRVGGIAGVIGAALAIVAILIAIAGIKAGYSIAEQSGSFDRPSVTLGIAGHRLRPGENSTIIVGITKVSEKDTVAIGSIPFSMVNEGSKTADTPSLTLQYSKLFNRKGLEAMQPNPSGPYAATEVKFSLTQADPFDYASYQARTLDPGVGLTVEEPFYAKDTVVNVNAPITFKDGAEAVVSVSAQYSMKFQATTIARDLATANYPIELAVTHAASMDEAISFAEKNFIAKQAGEFRKQFGFWKYLSGLLVGNDERRLYVVFESTTPLNAGENKTLEFAPKSDSAAQINYRVLSWANLFADAN
jgi:hypothetical protein